MEDDGEVVVVVDVHLVDPGRELDGLEVDGDADVGELRHDVVEGVGGVDVRRHERQLEPVGVAGLLEQRTGRVGVVGVDPGEILVPRLERRHGRPDQRAVAAVQVDQALLVDRLGDRLADALVGQHLVGVVHAEGELAVGRPVGDDEVGVVLELLDEVGVDPARGGRCRRRAGRWRRRSGR